MDLQTLIQDYLDGELSEQQLAVLSAWLAEDEANREVFVRATALDTQLYQQLTQSDLNQFLDTVDIHSLQSAINQSPSNKSGVFAASIDQDSAKPSDEISFKEAVAVLSHAGADLARKRLKKHAVPLALAAALAIVAALALVFMGEDEQPIPSVADNTDVTGPTTEPFVEPAFDSAVARLTGERAAQWQVASGSSSPSINDALEPGDRLVLTQGYAEITTQHGAVAILEAPAAIEVMQSPNAIRLHAGKLVGICETPSSKGFVVRTTHLDITDLGTRFGVEVSDQDAVEVHVFDGEVQLDSSDLSNPSVLGERLTIGQAARVVVDQPGITRVQSDTNRFANAIEHDYLPISTAYGLSVGDLDPNWRVVAMNGKPLKDQPLMRVTDRMEGRLEHVGDLGMVPFGWLEISESISQLTEVRARTYICRSSFELPDDFDHNHNDLVIGYQGGRAVNAVWVNGHSLKLSEAVTDLKSFYHLYETQTIDSYLQPGTNTIEIELYDTDERTTLRLGLETVPKH